MGACQSSEAAETLAAHPEAGSGKPVDGQRRESQAPGGVSAQPVSEQSHQTPPGSASQVTDTRASSGAKASTSSHQSAMKHGTGKPAKEKKASSFYELYAVVYSV